MHIFYDPHIDIATKEFFFSEEESKHICRVLRLRVNDQILVLNGKGASFNATITDDHPKKCRISIQSFYTESPPIEHIHIAIAPTKNIERIEWFLEKATEIGVDEVTFILCSNNERKQIKMERLEKIVVAAMKQSKRLFKPQLNDLTPYQTLISKNPNGLIAHCNDGEKSTISSVFDGNQIIVIGPEGDFSMDEIAFALSNGYKTISLGKNRLRTETAGLYACMQAKLMLDKD